MIKNYREGYGIKVASVFPRYISLFFEVLEGGFQIPDWLICAMARSESINNWTMQRPWDHSHGMRDSILQNYEALTKKVHRKTRGHISVFLTMCLASMSEWLTMGDFIYIPGSSKLGHSLVHILWAKIKILPRSKMESRHSSTWKRCRDKKDDGPHLEKP